MEESVYSCDISNTIVWNITIFPTSNNISFSQDLITDCMCRITFFQVQSIIIVNFIWLDIFIVYDDNRTSQRAKQFKEMVLNLGLDFEDSFHNISNVHNICWWWILALLLKIQMWKRRIINRKRNLKYTVLSVWYEIWELPWSSKNDSVSLNAGSHGLFMFIKIYERITNVFNEKVLFL